MSGQKSHCTSVTIVKSSSCPCLWQGTRRSGRRTVAEYEKILALQDTWHPSCRPGIYSADDERLLQFMSREFLRQGMETAKVIAVAGHKQVLEDGPEISTPESKQEEHGDVLEGMYTSDMLDEKGKSVLARAQMSAELAEFARRLRRERGQAQVWGRGKQATFECLHITCQCDYSTGSTTRCRRCRLQGTEGSVLAQLSPMPVRATGGYRCSQSHLRCLAAPDNARMRSGHGAKLSQAASLKSLADSSSDVTCAILDLRLVCMPLGFESYSLSESCSPM
jgi:hypothetical protein